MVGCQAFPKSYHPFPRGFRASPRCFRAFPRGCQHLQGPHLTTSVLKLSPHQGHRPETSPILTSSTHVENLGIPREKFLSGSSVGGVSAKRVFQLAWGHLSLYKGQLTAEASPTSWVLPQGALSDFKNAGSASHKSSGRVQSKSTSRVPSIFSSGLRCFPAEFPSPDPHTASWCTPMEPFPLAQAFLELQNWPGLVQNHIFA